MKRNDIPVFCLPLKTLAAVLLLLAASPSAAQQAARRESGNFGTLMMVTEDGRSQACELKKLSVRVAIVGDKARTEVEQVFYNPLGSDMEGTFDFELPPGAAVNRLALEIDGKLVDGELVERQRARQIYEKIVRAMRDPALMEWQSGDRFKTQVYPVPARGTKRVVLAYLTRLDHTPEGIEYRYALPEVAGGEKSIGDFSLMAKVFGSNKVQTTPYDAKIEDGKVSFARGDFRPRGDFVIRLPEPEGSSLPAARVAEAGGRRLFSLTLAPKWRSLRRTMPRDITILADSSASMRGKPYGRLTDAVEKIIDSLGPKDRVRVIAGDVELRPMRGKYLSAAKKKRILKFLGSLEPAGGTDLMTLLLAGAKRRPTGRRAVAIYLGDGQASLGELDGDLLFDKVFRAYRKAKAELYAVGLANPSLEFLSRLTRACMGDTVVREPGRALDMASLLKALDEPLLADVQIGFQNDCAHAVLPSPAPNLKSGENLEIMGQLSGKGICRLKLSGKVGGRQLSFTAKIDPASAGRSDLLPVFWARDRIAHLEHVGGDRKEIVTLSKEFGIMCRYTSWLVLENDEAYKRHRIERSKREQEKTVDKEAPTAKTPLKKAKLKEGESMSDLLKDYAEQDAKSSGAPAGAAEEMEEKKMDMAPSSPMAIEQEARMSPAPRMERAKTKEMEARPKPRPRKKLAKAEELRAESRESPPPPRISLAEQIKQAEARIKDHPHDSYQRQYLVGLLVGNKKLKRAHELIVAWLDEFHSDPEKLVALVAPAIESLPEGEFKKEKRIELYRLAYEAEPGSVKYLTWLVGAMKNAGKKKEALEYIQKVRRESKRDTDRLLALIPAYAALCDMPAASKALIELGTDLLAVHPMDARLRRLHLNQLRSAGLKKEAMAAMVDWRRYAPDFPELVLEHVTMLREEAKLEEAERVLSELVEFNPHDYNARLRYAAELAGARAIAKRGQPGEACAQYTRAVQLNPSKRETFRTMMALRRSHPRAAKEIKRCIVDGVSRLPVIRDVSIVMVWEDSSADIDMHIVEPGGEEVWYQHLESKQGGHLYYDVTDGYGPEIYVLGNGKPGTYLLSVVYYAGSAPVVRGKMIVMRHAGGPEEVRKTYRFTLRGADSDKKIDVGSFKLSR